ncbi:M24 family metallopeptidase [Corynebacterium minutissimum]|uniref:M24 family metallopeptidase n=1 Tax=Corynebacterium minutissimum TaxID=38301 RepID=UPI001EF29CD2|nr:aminopeptidase P family protein [Corynebacterium minutissimum]MCG7228233.1 aminopeptidase P family protein [Corynebacterium minutissimum]MCG7238583.1 aminopeptidase P family protein [Corynebacterium minutissimum]
MALADTRFSNRRRKLASTLAGQRIDGVVITHLTHVRYLTGFSGSNGGLLLRKDLSALMATDGRYTTQIADEVPDIEAVLGRDVGPHLLSQLDGEMRVGYEADYVSVSQLKRMEEAAPEGVTLVPVSGVIEDIRLIKDHIELQKLEELAALANQALTELIEAGEVAAGRTERQVAADLEYRMRMLGSERVSFDTIVASGENSAKPHHGADDRELRNGDLVTIDFGAHLRGFNSDCTRTFVIGEVSDFAQEIYDIVLRAQEAGVKASVPGASLVDVDAACRDIITEAGYGEYFVHSTGHGIGLDVHEGPSAAKTGKGELAEGMTLTIEPGIYVPGKGGVRIEDSLIITSGAPKTITAYPKDLQVL